MSDTDGGGKKVGVFGGMIAAIGMMLAKGADDCARIGAKSAGALGHSAPIADDVLRGAGRAAPLTDDVLRGAGRGAPLADDAMRGAGRGAAPIVLDEGALATERASGSRLLEEAASGASPGSRSAGAVADDGLDIGIDAMDLIDLGSNLVPSDEDDDREHGSSAPGSVMGAPGSALSASRAGNLAARRALVRMLVESPAMITVLPTTKEAYQQLLGIAPRPGEMAQIARVTERSSEPPEAVTGSVGDLLGAIERHSDSNPVVILGYSKGATNAIALSGGGEVRDAEIHRACLSWGMNCVVLACDPQAPVKLLPCVHTAYRSWLLPTSKAVEKGAMSLEAFTQLMIAERGNSQDARGLLLSRVLITEAGAKRSIVRSRPKSGGSQ